MWSGLAFKVGVRADWNGSVHVTSVHTSERSKLCRCMLDAFAFDGSFTLLNGHASDAQAKVVDADKHDGRALPA